MCIIPSRSSYNKDIGHCLVFFLLLLLLLLFFPSESQQASLFSLLFAAVVVVVVAAVQRWVELVAVSWRLVDDDRIDDDVSYGTDFLSKKSSLFLYSLGIQLVSFVLF